VAFSGKVTSYRGPQLVHPEYDKISEEGESDPLHTGGIVPLYPSTEYLSRIGLDGRGFRKIIRQALTGASSQIHETLPGKMLEAMRFVSRREALERIHFPKTQAELESATKRLKFEELFFLQLFLAFERRRRQVEQKGIAFEVVGDLTKRLLESLPFDLTEAQKRVLRDIRRDMKSDRAMNRLLQGDVGSGKTIVALVAMLITVENGYQAALMAPTEILAEQHFLTIHGFLETLGVRIALFKGSKRAAERREDLARLAAGEIDIAVGTHALVQKDVDFKNLGFVVIDEQHRFGVMQRAALLNKGLNPDFLVMTATPIPRTLTLTVYGDLEVSILSEKPAGRLPVVTRIVPEAKRQKVYEFVEQRAALGEQTFVVCPLVEESEKLDLASAVRTYEDIRQAFPNRRVGLVHGRMRNEERQEQMDRLRRKELDILVSTTVIEVGVDIPDATMMIVEHPERFGLAQLHQLRGRIGRSGKRSYCVLMVQPGVSEGVERLRFFASTTDGFALAEKDAAIRGPGQILGTRQHGLPDLRVADPFRDKETLEQARRDAFRLVEVDPDLNRPGHELMKKTLSDRYAGREELLRVG